MEARNFRYLFENTDDGIILSGGICDTVEGQNTNFVYLCGVKNNKEIQEDITFRFEEIDETCHIFVLGSFSIRYVKSLLKMVREGNIETVLLPYIAPSQRVAMLQYHLETMGQDTDFQKFLERPYYFLKEAGIENIYLLYGNGEVWNGDEEQLVPGHHFELADEEDLMLIQEMEGYYIPVVKAGYIVENKWLFYFGHYGRDINAFEQFNMDMSFRKQNIAYYRGNESLRMRMRQIPHEYAKQFGEIITSTIVMFQTPLDTDNRQVDSVMTGKTFTRDRKCIPHFRKEGRDCLLSCIYKEDYSVYRKHKSKDRKNGCFGILAMGNINLNRYLGKFNLRFCNILDQVRAITVPNCGSRNYWSRQCLTMVFGEDMRYWICGLDRITSSAVISDIVVASPKNVIVTISEEFGYCFSGYLVPYDEER